MKVADPACDVFKNLRGATQIKAVVEWENDAGRAGETTTQGLDANARIIRGYGGWQIVYQVERCFSQARAKVRRCTTSSKSGR